MPDVPPWLQRGRIPSLDGVRAAAITMVLLDHSHVTRNFPDLGPMRWIATLGLTGVEFFFALSGFLITLLLLREHQRTGGISLRQFYQRRILRIVPAYAVLLLAVALLSYAKMTDLGRGDWIAALTYTMNFRSPLKWDLGHLWSLSIEEQFYLVWPPLLLLMIGMAGARRAPALAATLAWGISFTCRCTMVVFFPHDLQGIEGRTYYRLDSIAAGCLLALLAWDNTSRRWLNSFIAFPGAWIVWLALLTTSTWISRRPDIWRYAYTWHVTGHYAIQALCMTALLWIVMCRERWPIGRLLNFRAAIALGTLSYSLYIWQQPFLKATPPNQTPPTWRIFPVNLLCVFAAGLISYFVIERPFLRWKNRSFETHG